MNKTQTNVFAEQLMRYISEEAKTNMVLANAMKKENKSESELVDYIVMKTTHGDCKSVIVSGEEIMKLVLEYYVDDSIVMPRLSAPKKEMPKQESKPVASASASKPVKATQKPSKAKKTEELMPSMFDF